MPDYRLIKKQHSAQKDTSDKYCADDYEKTDIH